MKSVARKLILIVDDYDDTAALLGTLVESMSGHEVIAVKNGEAALSFARQRKPDACVTDVDMPGIGGIDLARWLANKYGEERPLLIAMTGGNAEQARESSAFDHVLRKPFGGGQIVRLIEKGA